MNHFNNRQKEQEKNDFFSQGPALEVILTLSCLLLLITVIYATYPNIKVVLQRQSERELQKQQLSARIYQVKGIVVEKQYIPLTYNRKGYNPKQFLLLYQNTASGSVFKIDDAKLWAKAEKGDRIMVYDQISSVLGMKNVAF